MNGTPKSFVSKTVGISTRSLGLALSVTAMSVSAPTSAMAQSASPDQVAELRRQLDQLRAEQRQTTTRIGQIESALNQIAGAPSLLPENQLSPVSSAAAAMASPVVSSITGAASKLQLSGDVRARYESNRGDADARNRDRGIVRARLRGTYAISEKFAAGAQLSTGDPDDPNTADVTLSNWDDDLMVSLDQIYIRGTFGNIVLTAGKIPLPFRRTDLVWDGDVSPQGLSAAYKVPLRGGASLKTSGLFFQIDEAGRGPDSSMVGAQAEFSSAPGPFRVDLAAGYFDYSLKSLVGADAGDFRSNLLLPAGRYASDFNLLDIVGSATFSGLSERWPVQLVGNYVHNYGASVDASTAYGGDVFVGRTTKLNDLRIGYGYSRTEVDAVLAAFSHDNIDIATNYLLHSLSVDYVPLGNTLLNLTWYHYRPLDAAYAGANGSTDWLDRLRFNFSVSF